MAAVILFTSGKGGVGKSTSCAAIGGYFSSTGRKTLLVDADAGLGALDIMLGVSESVVLDWSDIGKSGVSFDDVVIKKENKPDLLPSPRVYSDKISFDCIKKIIDSQSDNYDYILIDSPAGVDSGFKRAASAADNVIIVATPDEVSVNCASKTFDECVSIGMEEDNIRLLINRFDKKAAKKSKLLNIDGTIDRSGIRLLGILPEDEKLTYLSVTNVSPGRKSKFYRAVTRVARRISGANVPLSVNKL